MNIPNLFAMRQKVFIRKDKDQEPHTVCAIAACDDGIIRYKLSHWNNYWYEEAKLSDRPVKHLQQ